MVVVEICGMMFLLILLKWVKKILYSVCVSLLFQPSFLLKIKRKKGTRAHVREAVWIA